MKNDYSFYYGRCMKNDPVVVKDRQAALASCICETYANKAVEQNKIREAKGCPATPISAWWSSNIKYHYNWCIRGANPS